MNDGRWNYRTVEVPAAELDLCLRESARDGWELAALAGSRVDPATGSVLAWKLVLAVRFLNRPYACGHEPRRPGIYECALCGNMIDSKTVDKGGTP